jgi:transposase
VLNGAVLAACKPRHRHQEYLSFPREIDKAVPTELDIHCIADNYATHNHPKIKAWLAARPRWHMHFIPTYSSWLNQVERFFSLITDKAIRRGSFSSVKQLVQRIDHFVTAYNTNCKPFKWTATAASILERLHRPASSSCWKRPCCGASSMGSEKSLQRGRVGRLVFRVHGRNGARRAAAGAGPQPARSKRRMRPSSVNR